MAHLRKGEMPIRYSKNDDEYSSNPLTEATRKRTQSLVGDELALHRAKAADRKAKHKALTKLRESDHYKLADTTAKEQMEESVALEVEDSRNEAGISASSMEAEMRKKIKKAKEELQESMKECLEERSHDDSAPTAVSQLGKPTLEGGIVDRYRQHMITAIKRQEWQIFRDLQEGGASKAEVDEFLGQVIDPEYVLKEVIDERPIGQIVGDLMLDLTMGESIDDPDQADDDIIDLDDDEDIKYNDDNDESNKNDEDDKYEGDKDERDNPNMEMEI